MTAATSNLPLPVPRFPGHPIFGNLPSFRRDRTAMQLRVAEALPDAAGLRMGIMPCVMLSNPALAYEVLQTKASSFTKAPGLTIFLKPVLGNGLLTSEGQFHASQRKLLAPAFMHKRIASYAETMRERAAKVASSVRDGQQLDVADLMMRLTLEIVGKTLFDAEIDGSDADQVGDALTTAMESALSQIQSILPVPPFIPTPTNRRLKRAVAQLDDILYAIIRARRGEKEDRGDLLSMLLAAQDEDGEVMNDKQIRDEAMTLFLAGHETTANALAWTLYLLAKNPEARAKVEAEVDALG
ncbi:MAG TPA: cytochrome P450, partial [Labilithrix sp.]